MPGMVPKSLENRLEEWEIRGRICGVDENDQNTEKSPGNQRRLVVTQIPVKDHQLMLE